MSQNSKFKLKFEQLRNNNPGGTNQTLPTEDALKNEDRNYPNVGYNRNVAFVPLGGKWQSFNYSYLVSITINEDQELHVIDLIFTSSKVTIAGHGLRSLFWDLFNSQSRVVVAIDPRYLQTISQDQPCVTEITIEP